ncbi:MAG: hypothetical protein A4E49_01396 [Methanosaeta sp. PtaU1.Bin112]|nr:MAG: hypothetical protein A4E49_01396 [Methanosaeta sp. PtaU1.Bin112]
MPSQVGRWMAGVTAKADKPLKTKKSEMETACRAASGGAFKALPSISLYMASLMGTSTWSMT